MESQFERFAAPHLLVLGAVPALAAALALFAYQNSSFRDRIRIGTAALLLAIETGFFLSILLRGEFGLDYGLPLQLTDTTALLVIFCALTLNRPAFDVAYYWSLTAMPLAMIMPDLPDALPDPYTILFFLVHGLAVTITLYLLWTGTLRPRCGSLWRSYVALNVYMIFVLIFNAIFGTNYMYLMQKPAQPSLLDYFGPWPVYILTGDALALALFAMLWLPYKRS